MYSRIYYDKFANEIHLWDDKDGYKKFPYKKYAYLLDDNGDVETINGKKVRKVTSWPETAEKLGLVFEHDVRPEMRTLIDLYYKSDDLPNNRIMCLDIEVRKNERYSLPIDADNEIVSIAYKLNVHDDYNIYVYNESFERETKITKVTIPETGEILTVNVNIFESEVSMLTAFMQAFKELDPTILTGWNIDFFDIPYMYNRMLKVCNTAVANSLSPIGKVKRNFTVDNKLSVSIAGRSIVDGMGLYKKFTYSEQPSYALEAISQAELGRGKVSYEGNLDQLFASDFNRFVYYNVVDVELPIALDAKLGYMDIAIATCHKGFVPYDDIAYPSMYIEGAILAFIKSEGKVATTAIRKHEEPARGAFVKDPTPGLFKWVYDLDLTSLYPWNIISLNISPDTKFGRILNYNEDEYVNNVDRRYKVELLEDTSIEGFFSKFTTDSNLLEFNSKGELETWIIDNNLSFSSIGILYKLDKIGIIPQILSKWFDERQEYKELMTQYGKAGDSSKEKYYDKKQLVVKTLLNSVYGVLLLQSFRFNDRENGESTTMTGQSVIQWATKKANEYYLELLKSFNVDYELSVGGKLITKNGLDDIKLKSGTKKYVFMLKSGDVVSDGQLDSIKKLDKGSLNDSKDFCIYTDTDSCRGDSTVRVNGNDISTLDELFAEYWNDDNCERLIDANNRYFIFPNIKLPYYNSNSIQLGNVQYIERQLCKKKQYKINLKNGNNIVITEDHSIMVHRDGELVEVKPASIKQTDKFICLLDK